VTVPRRYDVRVDRAAAKLLRKLDKPVQARLVAAIATLALDPRPAGVVALAGKPGLLRIRGGDHRVVYTVDDGLLIVLVVHLSHRRDVYHALRAID
jgi:mRNA interferase RelE/StbE